LHSIVVSKTTTTIIKKLDCFYFYFEKIFQKLKINKSGIVKTGLMKNQRMECENELKE
jgi:hypothetical protein